MNKRTIHDCTERPHNTPTHLQPARPTTQRPMLYIYVKSMTRRGSCPTLPLMGIPRRNGQEGRSEVSPDQWGRDDRKNLAGETY